MNDINSQLAAIQGELNGGEETEQEVEIEDGQGTEVESEVESEVEDGQGGEELDVDVSWSDGETPTNVSSLAEAIGWTPEDLYDIDVGMGDGKDPIKLGALKDHYETSVKAEATAKADVERLQGELTAATGQGGPQQINQEVMNAKAQVLSIQQQYNGYDWAKAELEDPGEAALLKQKFNEAFNQANGAVQYQQQLQFQNKQNQLQQGLVKLKEIIPAWTDNVVMQADQVKVKALMAEAGYPVQFIEGVDDPIAIGLMHELVQLRAEKTAATETVQRVRKAPKVIKGGKKKPNDHVKRLSDKAKQTGEKGDQIAAVRALLS